MVRALSVQKKRNKILHWLYGLLPLLIWIALKFILFYVICLIQYLEARGGYLFNFKINWIDENIPTLSNELAKYLTLYYHSFQFIWLIIPFIIYMLFGKKALYFYITLDCLFVLTGYILFLIFPIYFNVEGPSYNYHDKNGLSFSYIFRYGCMPSFHVGYTWNTLTTIILFKKRSKNSYFFWILLIVDLFFSLTVCPLILFLHWHLFIDIIVAIVINIAISLIIYFRKFDAIGHWYVEIFNKLLISRLMVVSNKYKFIFLTTLTIIVFILLGFCFQIMFSFNLFPTEFKSFTPSYI
jgi:hypothetical protein